MSKEQQEEVSPERAAWLAKRRTPRGYMKIANRFGVRVAWRAAPKRHVRSITAQQAKDSTRRKRAKADRIEKLENA